MSRLREPGDVGKLESERRNGYSVGQVFNLRVKLVRTG